MITKQRLKITDKKKLNLCLKKIQHCSKDFLGNNDKKYFMEDSPVTIIIT